MKRFLLLLAALTCAFLWACAPAPSTGESFAMDTIVTQVVYGGDDAVLAQNNQTLRDIESTLSRTIDSSNVSILNRDGSAEVSDGTAYILSACLEEARKTGGAFDPALGAVIELWGVGTENAHVPGDAQLAEALAKSGYPNISIDGATVDAGGAQIDLGGAAKGYALDEVRQNLEQAGVDAALISVGGSIYARGEKPDGKWTVGIRDPFGSTVDYIATLELTDTCISTSGIYERGFEENGVYYHHILDPQTGYPVDNGLISVSIVDESGLLTDIYSTALFVMGPEKGLAYANEHNIDALFITEGKEVLLTDGFDYQFTLKDSSYHEA